MQPLVAKVIDRDPVSVALSPLHLACSSVDFERLKTVFARRVSTSPFGHAARLTNNRRSASPTVAIGPRGRVLGIWWDLKSPLRAALRRNRLSAKPAIPDPGALGRVGMSFRSPPTPAPDDVLLDFRFGLTTGSEPLGGRAVVLAASEWGSRKLVRNSIWARQDFARPGVAGDAEMFPVDTLDEPIRFTQGKIIGVKRGGV